MDPLILMGDSIKVKWLCNVVREDVAMQRPYRTTFLKGYYKISIDSDRSFSLKHTNSRGVNIFYSRG